MTRPRVVVIYSPPASPLCPRINYLTLAKNSVGYFIFHSHVSRTRKRTAHFPYRALRLREVEYQALGHTARYGGRIFLAPKPVPLPLSHTSPLPKSGSARRFTSMGGSGPLRSLSFDLSIHSVPRGPGYVPSPMVATSHVTTGDLCLVQMDVCNMHKV